MGVRDEVAHERNVQIWEETGSPAALLEANRGLVVHFATRHALKFGRPHLVEDYIQAASVGFLHAFEVKPWDPERGTLGTFATMWMYSNMQSTVDRHDSWPGFSATHAMVQGITEAKLPYADSLQRNVIRDGTGERQLGDIIADPRSDDGYDMVERRLAARQDFEHLRDSVPEKYRALLDVWVTDIHVEEQAAILGMSHTTLVRRKKELRSWVAVHYPQSVTSNQ